MANFLAQFQSIKNSSDRLIVAVEDVSDLWPVVKDAFEERLPLKKACLNNKARNPVFVDQLPVEYILTTDARLRSRYPQEQYLFWFREPYATIVFVTCEDLDELRNILKPRLKLITQNEEREWFIIFVSKAHPSNDQATKMMKKIYARLEVDFNSKKRERCCKLDLHGGDLSFWTDFELKVVESIRNTLDRRVQFYEDEVRKLSENRFMPVWSFCTFFILKESLAFMFEMTNLHEDSLREYDELELLYLETLNPLNTKQKEFGGVEKADSQAAILKPENKTLTHILLDDTFREFEFRQYLVARQCKLLFKLKRPVEVASRGHAFLISFSKTLSLHENNLPFCFREVWIISACLTLIHETMSKYEPGLVAPDVEKEFYRIQGDLYSLARVKLMRLGYLVGYGMVIEKSPANSASLSMLPWPRPAVWPLVPPDVLSEVLAKEEMLQSMPQVKHFHIQRKQLPLEPSILLREANRRRASLSAGNVFEVFDAQQISNGKDGPVLDGFSVLSPPNKAPLFSRTNSIPGNMDGSLLHLQVDRPMKLAEIYVAAEHALWNTISDLTLTRSLSSVAEFQKKYLDLTKGAADNYHLSWWKRHGVVLDGEIAALSYKEEKFDLAARLYEKVCALYSGEGWHDLLAEILPNLADCQKKLNDQAGYLSSCIKLLSLDRGLFLREERQLFQSEVVRLAHSEMKHPVPLDVSSLVTFSGNPGPPLELCDGDPGILSVTVWSGFPDDISLESLSLTLIATYSADEGVKVIKSSGAPVLKPGKNTISLHLPPQNPGSYVLGVLTGQIGHLRFRSHCFSKGGPPDSDDFMSYEKPIRPVLKVSKPRQLVDISAAVPSALLMNEVQWVGLIIKPINYSLQGAVLHIDTGPGLAIETSCPIEIETYSKAFGQANRPGWDKGHVLSDNDRKAEQLALEIGKVQLPDWASLVTSVLWLPVCAVDNHMAKGTSSGSELLKKQSNMVDGMRTIALNLVFGVSQNQTFEKTVAVHFTDPFVVTSRVVDKCGDGTLVLQVVLHSQVKATVTLHDAWLDLQGCFMHLEKADGRPILGFFPLVCHSSRVGLIFSISLGSLCSGDEPGLADCILHIKYAISGDRVGGAHVPMSIDSSDVETAPEHVQLLFKSALALQKPVLDPCFAVGFLPFLSDNLRVGQQVEMKWRIERLKLLNSHFSDEGMEMLLYEVDANRDSWMIAGRKRGRVFLSAKQGSKTVVSVVCVPLSAGYVRPPHLCLPEVDVCNISCNPAGPHLVCVLPPVLSSSFCIPS